MKRLPFMLFVASALVFGSFLSSCGGGGGGTTADSGTGGSTGGGTGGSTGGDTGGSAGGTSGGSATQPMTLQSNSFQNGGTIPNVYAYTGCAQGAQNRSPHLKWSNPPQNTRSFVIIMEDPDAPSGTFTHWIVYNIPANTTEIPEGGPIPSSAREGQNDYGDTGYGGPCPPIGTTHRYFFRIYAINTETLNFSSPPTRSQILQQIQDKTLGQAEIMGRFSR